MTEERDAEFLLNEGLDMLKALYDFQAVYPKTISFDEGEYFILHQTSARQRNWWQVVSMKGNVGFVPSNYVMKIKAEPKFFLGFLESSIESLKMLKDSDINGIISRVELIRKLEDKKEQIQMLVEDTPTIENGCEQSPIKQSNGSVQMRDNSPSDHSDSRSSSKPSSRHELTRKSQSSPSFNSAAMVACSTMKESVTVNTITPKPDEFTVNNPPHDTSIASEPSDANTITTSDDATIVSRLESVSKEVVKPDLVSAHATAVVAANSTCAGEDNADGSNVQECNTGVVEAADVYQIVDSIRQNTNLSFELSCVALKVVLAEIQTLLPVVGAKCVEPVAVHLVTPISIPDDMIARTHDAQRLRVIFTQLADCKNDSEQRTWILHEDEDDIIEFLTELVDIVTNADPKICHYELADDHYQSIINLVQYYQMETRWTIRKVILQAFKALCKLEFTTVDVLLTSVLPLELIEDLKSNANNVQRLKEVATMLTMIFSIGLKIPTNHQESIGPDFVIFILNSIENDHEQDHNQILPDIMINLLLAFNLQYDDFTESCVLDAVRQVSSSKILTEKILLLINREEDPVKILDHTSPPINSVLKLFIDLFSTPETASIFYTNDNKVLIDILVRQLSDLSPGDPIRRHYLELCRRILRNTDYSDHQHRKQDLMKIFTRIFCEETECSAKDQQLVREIANEFPQIFKA